MMAGSDGEKAQRLGRRIAEAAGEIYGETDPATLKMVQSRITMPAELVTRAGSPSPSPGGAGAADTPGEAREVVESTCLT